MPKLFMQHRATQLEEEWEYTIATMPWLERDFFLTLVKAARNTWKGDACQNINSQLTYQPDGKWAGNFLHVVF